MHLRYVGSSVNHFIRKLLPSLSVKFFFENRSMFGRIMDKSALSCFVDSPLLGVSHHTLHY